MNRSFHGSATRKCEGETNIVDGGLHVEEFPDHWSLIADKGYQGTIEFIRAVAPNKRPARGILSFTEEEFNRKVSSEKYCRDVFRAPLLPIGTFWQ